MTSVRKNGFWLILSGGLFVFILGFLLSGGCGKVVTVPTTSTTSSSVTSTNPTSSTSTTLASGWSPVSNVPTTEDFNAVFFPDTQHGWIGGKNGVVFRTTNEGVSWKAVSISGLTTEDVKSISIMQGGEYVFILAQDSHGSQKPKVFSSLNGGVTWETIENNELSTNPYASIFATGNSFLWLTGDGILSSFNGGFWVDEHSKTPNMHFANQIYFLWVLSGYQQGYYIGQLVGTVPRGCIYYTSNGGTDWTQSTLPDSLEAIDNFGFTSVASASLNNAVAVGSTSMGPVLSQICKTSNGGASWTVVLSTEATVHIQVASFADSLNGWAMGTFGDHYYESTDGGDSWHYRNFTFSTNGYGFNAIFFPSANRGWAVGGHGEVIRYVKPGT